MTEKYRMTKDVKKMMTNKEFDEALQTDLGKFMVDICCDYYLTSTHISYEAGATEALIWNEGETKKTKIKLPLQEGWHRYDKKYGIPNGKKVDSSDSNARYLWRNQTESYLGPLVRGVYGFNRRGVVAYGRHDDALGVEKISAEDEDGAKNGYNRLSKKHITNEKDKELIKLLDEEEKRLKQRLKESKFEQERSSLQGSLLTVKAIRSWFK